MKKIKTLAAALLALLMVVNLVACGGSASSSSGGTAASSSSQAGESDAPNTDGGEPVNLTFWNNFTADDGEILREMVDEFNATNGKNITVEMDIMPQDQLLEKLPLSISSNTAPDFFACGAAYFGSFATSGTVRDLTGYWDYDGVDKSNYTDGSVAFTQVGGVQYFLPMQVQGFFMFWNKDLFEAAGLDPEKGPETWEEVAEYAAAIADPANNVYGFGMPNNDVNTIANWFLAYGGQILTDDQSASALNSPQNLQVLTTVRELIYEQKVGPENPAMADLGNLMSAGQLGIIMNGPWMSTGLKNNEINFGVSKLPAAEGSDNAAYLSGVGLAIPTSTDESKIEAIYEFFKFWHSDASVKRWSLDNGFPPYLKSVVQDPDVQANEVVAAMSEQIEYAQPFLPGNAMIARINADAVNPMVEAVMLGEDPQTALETADATLNELLA